MKNKKGWVGIGVFLSGIAMLFFDQTKHVAGFPIGFGLVLIAEGFKNENG